jgi:trehalose 6-phosphate phosphatase
MTGRLRVPGRAAGSPDDPAVRAAATRVAGLAALRPILVVTDFDGTLCPIVDEPSDARIVPAARRALERLQAATLALPDGALVVAVLSGRDARDVAGRVGVPGLRYLGQHGIETARLDSSPGARPVVETDPELAASGTALERLADRAAELLGRPAWLAIEPKGASVGIHYRRAERPDEARVAILAALDAALEDLGTGEPDRLESRRVVELRPAGSHGKDEATRRLIDEVGPAVVLLLGDDRTDADGFRAVRALRDAGRLRALVVGVSGAAETPDEVRDSVDVMVGSPEAAAAVLEALADALAAGLDAGPGAGHSPAAGHAPAVHPGPRTGRRPV